MQPLTSDDPVMIGGYRLQARLGAGGMGRVYLAFTAAGRPVALKVVRSDLGDDQDFRVRFRQEIQAAQRVRGLYTAELIDADPAATPPWLVTAFVQGPSLQEVIDNDGPMQEAMVFRLIAGVAEALQAIHAAGVIHRDLKPSNVLLAHDGPRVIDFGIARALAETPMTRSEITMGSPDFMSPEQILDLPVTPAIDVFALGSLAAFAATGRLPFGHGHITEVAHRVVHEPPDLAGCPAGLVPLIQACLGKKPEARPAPGQILQFCVARAASLANPGQPRPAAVAIGAAPSGSAWSAHSTTVVLPDPALLVSQVRPRRRRLPIVAGLAAIALAAVVIAIAVASHLSAGRATAGRATATRHPVTVRAPARPHPVALLSQGRPVTASSVQPDSSWVAANAVDGNLGTRWSSEFSDPQWLEVDLGSAHAITKVVLDWETAYASAFQIQVSDNGVAWTDIYSMEAGPGGAQTLQVHGTGRYVRMYGTQRATQWGYSLWEFQVFGT
jgi:hypothetical protein